MSLKHAVAGKRVGETTFKESPIYDSQGNGDSEVAVRIWRVQFTTLKHAVEEHIRQELKVDDEITSWLAVWAAEVVNRYRLQDCGKTAFERSTGRKWNVNTVPFGETILFKKALPKTKKDKFKGDWTEGIFVGASARANELYVSNKKGIWKTRSIRRKVNEEKWDLKAKEMVTVGVDQIMS